MLKKHFKARVSSGFILFTLATAPLVSMGMSLSAVPISNEQKEVMLKSSDVAINDKVTYEGAFHHLVEVSLAENTVKLEDGSRWSIKSSEMKNVEGWKDSDTVVITQNTALLSYYKYSMLNLDNGVVVPVNLWHRPAAQDSMRWVKSLDTSTNQVLLSDGSRWNICSSDYGTLHILSENDRIVIGANAGSDNDQFPYLLIDCEHNFYIRAVEANGNGL